MKIEQLTIFIATLSLVTRSVAKYILPWAPLPNTSCNSYLSHRILGIFLIISMYSSFWLASVDGLDVSAVFYV